MLFCDVVGSTHLAETLDAEDLRNLLLSFQKVCAEVVQRHEGQIGLFIGDGVTAYFGYPRAHEDSAQRAVQAGLDIMAGLTELGREGLEARCGVHTGPVVVGELGVGEKRLCDGIVGEAPNIAARLQALAPPGSLVMSEATLRLVEGFFEVEPLGPQMLKGVSAPITIYRVLRPSAAPNRFEARSGQFLTPLIGRETELGFLTKRWENAMEGEGQAVLLQGEAGIGKSRLLQTLRMQLRETPHTEIVFYGSPQHQTSALWPVIQQLHRALGFPAKRMTSRGASASDTFSAISIWTVLMWSNRSPCCWVFLRIRGGMPAQRILNRFAELSSLPCRGLPLQCSGEAQSLWLSRMPTGLIPRPQNLSVRCSLTWRPNGFSFC